MYREDDRYEVEFFINVDENCHQKSKMIYPVSLSGKRYPRGIPIIPLLKFKSLLQTYKIDKCVFSHFCVTSGLYLNFAAQCLASQCPVISHNIDSTKIPPTKPVVSFFFDTQFHLILFTRFLNIYRNLNPIVVIDGPLSMLSDAPFIRIPDKNVFIKYAEKMNEHMKSFCETVLFEKIQIIFVYDYEAFSSDSLQDQTYDIVISVGFNSLPCFFNSHFTIYACDDFTFGDRIDQHPSSVILKQSDVIIACSIKDPEFYRKFSVSPDRTRIVPVSVQFSLEGISDPHKILQKECLLVDDPYPTKICCAVSSISQYISSFFGTKSIPIPEIKRPSVGPIFYEPTENQWPALIYPDYFPDIQQFEEIMIQLSQYEYILTSTNRPLLNLEKKIHKPILRIKFELDLSVITEQLLELPAGAFVRPRMRRV